MYRKLRDGILKRVNFGTCFQLSTKVFLFIHFSGKWLFAGMVGWHLAGFAYYCKVWRPQLKQQKTEANGFRLALQPLLLAGEMLF